ncbi:uncharacterized protein LOC114524679 [Dendronephthya gigantea]|uniref:uncharacterized protein LOC114524679 n=1 Tax=Dendronephthya gigantea TaxID=151771 RepID=UPI00106D8685|nr:uncharacterized protein LOC114524679 [Dendronephthya gigantea]
MTAKSVSFRIDVILQSVNELRQEKQALEQRYAEEKYRSKNIEIKLEQERVKFCQSRDRNSKMQETVKLAQQKVAQTDNQAERLNEINDAKQKILAGLNEKIKIETIQQENDANEFQVKLKELTKFFRDAKRTYSQGNLTKETKEWKDNMDTIINEAEAKTNELEDVTKAFENLSVDTSKIKDLVGEKMGHQGLTFMELKAAIDQLTRAQEQLQKFLNWLESCENNAVAEVQHFTVEQECGNGRMGTEMSDVTVRNITLGPTSEKNFPNGQHSSETEYHETKENDSILRNDIQPPKNVDQMLRNPHQVLNQNVHAPEVTHAVLEDEDNVNQDVMNFHNILNQNDQGNNHHAVSNQNKCMPVTRATSAHSVSAVNSPSFFISLPFGRTR